MLVLVLVLVLVLQFTVYRPTRTQEQVAPLKVRRIVTNAVSWCQKCAQDRRSEVVGFDVMSHVALSELLEARL